jgi:Tol biopolymer transport system component
MSITAPPRPPRPGDPADRDELEALVNALIEEARRRARRRRLLYAVSASLVAIAGSVVFAVFDRTANSQGTASGFARAGLATGAARSQIAFTRDPGPNAGQAHKDLYVMNPDGSGQRLLAHEAGLGWDIAWSSDGREIAFLRAGSSGDGGLHVVTVDGSAERLLTPDAVGFDWASDGTLAFTTIRGGYRDIWVMNADGSGERRLVERGLQPRWSPDGRQLAFTSRRDGNWEIYVINADGSGLRNLSHNPSHDLDAAWSPDARRIVFKTLRHGNWELYVMNADGSGQRRLTRTPAANESRPSWSADGQKIAFTRAAGGNFELYVMNADGGGQRRLTPNSPVARWVAFAWSP